MSTAAKHTPGPWEFRVYSGGCTIVSKHDQPGRSVRDHLKGVAVLVDARINDDQSNAHEASPDARLIAAAPETAAERDRLKASNAELISALWCMVFAFEQYIRTSGQEGAMKEAREMIAKATK